MKLKQDGHKARVVRGFGANFQVGPLDHASSESCSFVGTCGRGAVYRVPARHQGQIYESRCCREHLYRWAHEQPSLERTVANKVADPPVSYWRPVQLHGRDVPDVFPINSVCCAAIGLDEMQRAHYLSPSLSSVAIGVLEDGEFVHERDSVQLGDRPLREYYDLVASKGPGWYAHRDIDRVRSTAMNLEPRSQNPVAGGAD